MSETLPETVIKERVDDWIAAFSPGNKPFDFSALNHVYWQDEQLLAFDTLSPQTTRIAGWKSFEEIWKPFMSAKSAMANSTRRGHSQRQEKK